ncbi:CoA-binding protein [Chitinivibrio alkaliphilus]|uniref:CoA-binding domain protein n=1 Tax=Chitinivibrio alkaliphilus ACht1 TaxID=1313304 RepID=U7DEK7_9BACT|nr:CoA-binding protein [Chitinivibrio alkaliphilus]ERP39366.1 CoA-binding domain protein [Chitinivibrio alkaliphilus ACht1]
METVAVLGASAKTDRYSYKAFHALREKGHTVHAVHPGRISLGDIVAWGSLKEIPDSLDTVTIYVNPQRLERVLDEIIAVQPRRVILNPGTESSEAERVLTEAGITVQKACTLVLLRTNQY